MIAVLSSDVRHAVEFLLKAPARERITAAHILLCSLSNSGDIGVTGKGFLQEADQYLQTILDWIAVGANDTMSNNINTGAEEVIEDSDGA
jgi:hypothetical protein